MIYQSLWVLLELQSLKFGKLQLPLAASFREAYPEQLSPLASVLTPETAFMKLSTTINRGFSKVYTNFNTFAPTALSDNASFFAYKFTSVRVITDLKPTVQSEDLRQVIQMQHNDKCHPGHKLNTGSASKMFKAPDLWTCFAPCLFPPLSNIRDVLYTINWEFSADKERLNCFMISLTKSFLGSLYCRPQP